MQQALKGLDGKGIGGKIDYINPHGTGTPVGDLREIEAIRKVFNGDVPKIAATKSLTGHSLGAVGVQEAIFSLLMMNNGFICESANIEEIDPAFADMPIVRERRDNAKLGCVLSNAFGFGGTNRDSGRCSPASNVLAAGHLRPWDALHTSGPQMRLMAANAALIAGGRQRPFHRLGHRQAACRAGRRARLHLPDAGAGQAGGAAGALARFRVRASLRRRHEAGRRRPEFARRDVRDAR
jgi:hypothetical protein